MSRIGVVVVTYGSDDVLPDLLASLAQYEPEATVVVVDDASEGGAPTAPGVDVVVMEDNVGYATCANRGAAILREHDVDYLAFLNPDVRVTGPSLTALADALDERPDVGIATGPVLDAEGRLLPSAWGPTSVRRAMTFAAGFDPARLRSAVGEVIRPREPTPSRTTRTTRAAEVDVEGHVMGGTLIARRACFDALHGFDEDFFLYWEDADLCHRAREAGWHIRVLPCDPFENIRPPGTVDDDDKWTMFVEGAERFGHKHLVPGQARQLDAALQLGRRLGQLRKRG